jgi:hypothetical protein
MVGNQHLDFRGLIETVKLDTSLELGALLFRASELAVNKAHG